MLLTHAGVQAQDVMEKRLLHHHIPCHLVDVTADTLLHGAVGLERIPGVAAPMHEIKTQAQVTALPRMKCLVEGEAHVVVSGMEQIIARFGSRRVSVVDVMVAPVDISLNTSVHEGVGVVGIDRRGSPEYICPHAFERRLHRSGIVGFALGHIDKSADTPVRARGICQIDVLVCRPELRTLAIAVAPVELPGDKHTEFVLAVTGGKVEFLSVIAAEHCTGTSGDAVVLLMSRDYIDRTTHGIRAIEQRRRALDYLDTLHSVGHICVGQFMSEYRRPLRLAIDHKQYFVVLAHTTDIDRTCRTVGYSIPGQSALRHKHAGYLRRQHRKQRTLRAVVDYRIIHNSNIKRQ